MWVAIVMSLFSLIPFLSWQIGVEALTLAMEAGRQGRPHSSSVSSSHKGCCYEPGTMDLPHQPILDHSKVGNHPLLNQGGDKCFNSMSRWEDVPEQALAAVGRHVNIGARPGRWRW